MGTVEDRHIGVWVCPRKHDWERQEFGIGGPLPTATRCGYCGEELIRGCPKRDCPDPTFHPSDLNGHYHRPCGTLLPWVQPFFLPGIAAVEADRLAEGDERRRKVLEAARKPGALEGENTLPSDLLSSAYRELTPAERQDLVVPPSERPPTTGLVPPAMPAPQKRDMSTFVDSEATRMLRDIERNQAQAAKPKGRLASMVPSHSSWARVWSGLGSFIFGSMQNTVGTILALTIVLALLIWFGIDLNQ